MAGKPDDVAARGDGPPRGAGGAGGPRVTDDQQKRPTRSQRWLARLVFAAAIAAVVVLVLFGGLRSIAALLLGFAGLAIACAAAWWFLAHRGIVRWLALVVLVAAPVFVIVVYVVAGLVWEVVISVVLAAAAVAAGRAALSSRDASAGPPEYAAARQRQPFMIMNPRSGGGKVTKFGLKDKAAAFGAQVTLLEGPGVVDVAALARHAVDGGALTAREVIIDSGEPQIPVGIDGESVLMPTPVTCTIRPLALRVQVPRDRPGVPEPRPQLDWARLRHQAFTIARTAGADPAARPGTS